MTLKDGVAALAITSQNEPGTDGGSHGGSSVSPEKVSADSNNNDDTVTRTTTTSTSTGSRSISATSAATSSSINAMGAIVKNGIGKEIARGVLRKKLSKMRHLVIRGGIHPMYLDALMPTILNLFAPQTVTYNGGVAKITEWKISCYLEVMEGGVPCTNPNLDLLRVCKPLLDTCNDLFAEWYRQQHSCNNRPIGKENKDGSVGGERPGDGPKVKRLMTFITRYTAAPGEQALLKHVDGAGKVDGSVVVALPIDRWSGPEEENSFYGHGGGLTFWDGKGTAGRPQEIQYDTRSGDIAFIDRAVWHQANPITEGTRWALVIFYKVA